MISDDYDRLTEDHHGPTAEVAIIIRQPDGTETQAAVFHEATVMLETASEIEQHGWPAFPPSRITGTAHQMRVTTTSGLTMYDPSFFNQRQQIEEGR